jgi:hypothetical protein
MALPASQYSVLDGTKVDRLSGDTFRVYVPEFKFFAFEVQPVLTLQVQALERGCLISMLACKLRGSRLIENQNSQFAARMTNKGMVCGMTTPPNSQYAGRTTSNFAVC